MLATAAKILSLSLSLSNSQLKPACLALGGLSAFALITGAFLTSSRVSADDNTVIDDVSITVPVSCSMSGNVTTAHTASLMNGTYSGGTTEYANGIGSTTLSVSCNDAGGFSIYTVGFTGDKEGDNTLKGTNTGLTIPTGVYSQGDTTSKWSMKITKGADSGDTTNHPLRIDNGFDSFHTVPSESEGYQRIAHKDAATDMNATPGASVTTTYDAYIDTTQAADTYTGQVKYVMVHPYDSDEPIIPTLYMQDVDKIKTQLADKAVGTELEVVDKRDNKTYTVAKLADENIWLLDNLAFDPTATGTTMTESDTNAPAAAINVFLNGGTAAQSGWTSSKVTNGSISSFTAPEIQNGYINTIPSDDTSQAGRYKIGVYYNYCAATAGTYCYAEGAGTGNAQYDICPAGWRMPTSDSSGEYKALYNNSNYNTYDKYRAALHLPLSGYYSSSAYRQGSNGYFWSSTRDDGNSMYYLRLDTSNVNPQSSDTRDRGFSVRCVAK